MPVIVTSVFGALVGAVGKALLSKTANWVSKEFLEWVFFWGSKALADHPDTPQGPAWLVEVRKLYEQA